MSLRVAARLARRELRGGLSGFRIFIACLALGVAAIAAVGTVRSAIEGGLQREGAALLGGDAEAEFTYRFAREDELTWLRDVSERISETVDFRSMAVVPGDTPERALTQVKGVDGTYPLVGAVELDPAMPLDEALAGDGERPGLVMEPLLANRLGLAPGDTVRLGDKDFVLSARLESYPDNTGAGLTLGPRTVVRTEALEGSGLLREGTLFETQYRLDLPAGADLDALAAEAESRWRDSGMRWRDARQGAAGISEFVDRLGAFLILVGLSGLAVGGIGVSSAVRAYLAGKTEVIATLKTLGGSQRVIFLTYFLQIGVLTLLGIAVGLVLGVGLPLLFAPLIQARLPIPAEFGLYLRPPLEAGLYGLLAAMIFTLWPLARAARVRAAALFRDSGFGITGARPDWRALVAVLVLLAALLGAAIAFSGAPWLTLSTAGGIAGALALLAIAAEGIRRLTRPLARRSRGRPAMRLALGAIAAQRGETLSVVLSLGLGLSVLAAIGQIDGTMRRAITEDLPEVAPSFFFVDIQPGQIGPFRAQLDTDPAVSRVESAPMLRGIITRINGQDAVDVAEGHWVVRGDRGVTYSAQPPEDTRITSGEWWPENYDGPPLMSFSVEEAEEIGLALGDSVTVNILGREITAEVTSFRQVDFETAGIGFVMSMNPAALEGAPHSWISTVYADAAEEPRLLRELTNAYPNITAIGVRDAIARVMELLSGISAATRYGAAATLLTGLLVLIGAAAAGERARTYEAAVLKTLGASRGRILASFALRSALLGAAAGVVALGAGVLGGWAVARFVMETGYAVIWSNALAVVIGGAALALLAGLAFALRPLSARPARVLRARE